MAEPTMYAWSPIHTSKDGKAYIIPIGDVVNKDDVPGDWDYLVDQGAIRSTKYPADVQGNESPTEYYKRLAAEAAEGGNYMPPIQEEERSTPQVPTT